MRDPAKTLILSFYNCWWPTKIEKIKEVRLKVFLKRDSDLSIPSLYKIFKEVIGKKRNIRHVWNKFYRSSKPKRLLMPEDWGWPLRKTIFNRHLWTSRCLLVFSLVSLVFYMLTLLLLVFLDHLRVGVILLNKSGLQNIITFR